MRNFDFIGKSNIWFMISAIVVLVSVLGIVVMGFNYSIDFKGGSAFDVRFKKGSSLISASVTGIFSASPL